jgi:capsular polysaccharide biosynthesis protein
MEFLDYLTIARRWWWLIVLPALVVAVYGLATDHPPPASFSAAVRYTAAQPATLTGSPGYDPNYYRWLTSEYIVTALKTWVQSGAFAQAVSAELGRHGSQVPAGALAGALGADNSHSILVVSLTWGDPGQVTPIFDAITAVLQNQNAAAFPELGGQAALVQALDSPGAALQAPSLRSRLDLPLKAALGLALGVGLALAAHYLDPFVRDRRELERLGLPVVGEIPRSKR